MRVPSGIYSLADFERRERAWPNAERIAVALQLAADLETARALLRGEPVDPDRVNREALEWAREARWLRMVRPIDVLVGEAA